ncbi:disease resistance protein RPV1-like [Eucalyptus grandis]|uniref:disease resistance protein RPV1-like n=1 Tax=Eucalyptus grandis TaxID=71139 RepID=UPI00192E97DB|nr:disease resistance protein RPV1-like [Eucalyptus grandis]
MASSDAGTSSGSEYQVFLNFRGPDTRVGFTDFLFHSLIDAGIRVFRDDEELRVSERIDGLLLQAIDNSRIYIPIFSRNYASSQWCLRELVQIVANTFKTDGNKVILPIFFDVEPDDVKLKTPLYRNAILKLKHEKKLNNEQVDTWREALIEVDAIKGWEVKKYKGHGELIKLVVKEVVEKLKTKHRSVTEYLVGIDDQVVAVSKLLDINSDGARLIKIHGMGGIGKTTLAKVIFNQLSSHFGKYCYFLEDVREKSLRIDGLVDLQKRLLSELGHPAGTISINEIDYGMKRTGEVLCNKKVLIVLDDIDNNEQVEKLVGKSPLYSGSRILITTRNKDVLQINTPKYQILDYEMEVINIDCALELFSKHAFNRDSPLDDYHDLSREIVYATGRLPLALEVIGSLLYHKPHELWKETLEELRNKLHRDVYGKLKIGYDALSFEQRQIFLDIACFFIGEDKRNAIYMWKDCNFSPNSGVDVLINMSLVKIVKNNKFWMHDQLRDLGRKIVRQENPINPKERSRIWIWNEVLDATGMKEINKKVQALSLDTSAQNSHDVIVQSKEIGREIEAIRMRKLKEVNVEGCVWLIEIQFSWVFESLEALSINHCMSLEKIIYESANELISCEGKLIFPSSILTKFRTLKLWGCQKILDIQVVGTSETWEYFQVFACLNVQSLGGLSNLKNLKTLSILSCNQLQIVKSVDELEFLDLLQLYYCGSLERLIDVSTTKLPNDCHISIASCRKLRGVKKRFEGSVQSLKHSKASDGRSTVPCQCIAAKDAKSSSTSRVPKNCGPRNSTSAPRAFPHLPDGPNRVSLLMRFVHCEFSCNLWIVISLSTVMSFGTRGASLRSLTTLSIPVTHIVVDSSEKCIVRHAEIVCGLQASAS